MRQVFLEGLEPANPAAHRSGQRMAPDTSPCAKCPFDKAGAKVPPTLPSDAMLLAVGLAPGKVEETEKQNFVGPAGNLLRSTLRTAGIPVKRVGLINLTRCRPAEDDFDLPEWATAAKRCNRHLSWDVGLPNTDRGRLPLLVLGQEPAARFVDRGSVLRDRGLWHTSRDGRRRVFVARHPAAVLRDPKLLPQFQEDIRRMADHLLDRVQLPALQVKIFPHLTDAVPFLQWMLTNTRPWAFDCETYDCKRTPSRPGVATDPCHDDFRVRGVAIALNATQAVWIELMSCEAERRSSTLRPELREALALLAGVFVTPAEKYCQNGGFDEDAMTVQRWVRRVRNRAGDSMLGAIALGDGRRSNRLERLVVDLLGEPQWWDGLDKSLMAAHAIEKIAWGACRDAVGCLKVCNKLHEMMDAGIYL